MTTTISPVNGHDLDAAAPEVLSGSDGNSAVQVRLHDRRFLGDYETTFAVEPHPLAPEGPT
jgi:hypothetical protein